MTDPEFRDEIETALKRHAADLDPEDVRDVAASLEGVAESWEGIDL